MIYVVLITMLLLLIYGPNIWVLYVLKKHNQHIEEMPGTGAELAQHLIERFKLTGVTVKKSGPDEDYYSPGEKVVALSPKVHDGKSITAIAVAAHEVGHAIQHCRKETVSQLRDRYSFSAEISQNIGISILSVTPMLMLIFKAPVVLMIGATAGVLAMLSSVLMYAMILPEEFDASFSKALPILSEGYLSPEQLPAAKEVLRSCALTYVSGALSDILSVWRWLSIIK